MYAVNLLPVTNAPPTSATKATVLRNLEFCSAMAVLKQNHAQIIKLGLSFDNDVMGRVVKFCALSVHRDLSYALKVFHSLPHPDAFVHNTLFRGYIESGMYEKCVELYLDMLGNFVFPNNFSFPPVIRACGYLEEAKQVHAHVIKFGFSQDSFCQNNLMHLYVIFGCLNDARKVFNQLTNRNDVSWTTIICGLAQRGYVDDAIYLFESMSKKGSAAWNAVISACVKNGRFHQAFTFFDEMKKENVALDTFVATSMLTACAGFGALEQGEWIHEHIKSNRIKMDTKLATSVINMYCKCGRLEKALQVFDKLPSKSISSWNCIIGGLAMHGKGKVAIEFLKRMESDTRLKPDYVTFVNILAACAHSGLVEEGKHYFSYMTRVYGIKQGNEHYGCLVDLLGRFGLLEDAKQVIAKMPNKADAAVLGALLGAYKIHGNIDMAEKIGWQTIELEPSNSGRYVLLANLYAKAGKWNEVAHIRKLMNDRGVKKVPGLSSIEFNGKINNFIAGERTHPEAEHIYRKVEEMLSRIRDRGYCPDSNELLHDIIDEETENPLHYHSEKLAVAYGLLKTEAGETIRVTKNLRVCRDCHEVCKLISDVYDREIVLRDRNRFHHFNKGACSCKDFW